MKQQSCQCPGKGVLNPVMAGWYSSKELPFVNHEPGKCKCTNDVKLYLRGKKRLRLCSCCCLSDDELIDK